MNIGVVLDRRRKRTDAQGQQLHYEAVVGWVFWGIVLANALVIVWLWWQGGNVTGVHRVSDALNSIGRITGLLGAYLLLLQVLLLARLPWMEKLTGFDRLTRWHRLNGKICLYLILAHVVFITIGYTMTDRLSLGSEISTLLGSYPGMVEATIGTGLIVLTVITSLVIVRQRMRYEWWYLVHLTAYVGIWLTWIHEIPTGNEFAVNATAAAYWTALYIVTLGLVILFRVAQPVLNGVLFRMRVSEVELAGPNVVSLRITGRHLDRLGAQPGQFFMWRFLSPGRWWEAHPFSLSEAPNYRSLRITVKDLGDFTGRLETIKPGTPVLAEGPFGVFTAEHQRSNRVALVAGGIGITPIRSLMEVMSGDIVVIYRVVREEDILFRDELERLRRERGIRLHYVIGDHRDAAYAHLMGPEHLRQLVPDIADREVYVCGPVGMTQFLESSVRQAGVPRGHIHAERFAL